MTDARRGRICSLALQIDQLSAELNTLLNFEAPCHTQQYMHDNLMIK